MMVTRLAFFRIIIISFLFLFDVPIAIAQEAEITGEHKAFHKLSFTWTGPEVDESASTFKNYRLDVTFISPDGQTFVVPGYFAADGRAAESGASRGNKWRCHFTPGESGEWSYRVSFRTGPNLAIEPSAKSGSSLSFDGGQGNFTITDTDKSGLDFRGKGKLQYVGEHFLRFTNGEYFLKVGANSPEVFLEYADFDGTISERTYPAHISEWNSNDPSWKNGKGKGILGVLNYLSGQGINAHYFMLMNAYGDGKNAFPWTGPDDYYQYDVSKLDQWQIVFDHMMTKGIMPHFVLSEQENQSYFEYKEGGLFADSRKVFYREMVARFGYLNALTWNIGEESGWEKDNTYGKAITDEQRKSFAEWLQNITYYDDHIVVHNGPSDTDTIFSELILEGNSVYTGISYQGNLRKNSYYGHDRILHWKKESAKSGHNWVVTFDEPYTSPEKPDLDTWRKNAVWASLLAGGAGLEFYIGDGKDLSVENYNLYSPYWVTLKNAHNFFVDNQLPFAQMQPQDSLTTQGWCLAKAEEAYILYLPEGGSADIQLPKGTYSVRWYNPRTGGRLQNGSVHSINNSGGTKSIGIAPSETDLDWVVLVQKSSGAN